MRSVLKSILIAIEGSLDSSTGRSKRAGQPKIGFGTIDDNDFDERVRPQSWELAPVSDGDHEEIIRTGTDNYLLLGSVIGGWDLGKGKRRGKSRRSVHRGKYHRAGMSNCNGYDFGSFIFSDA